MNEQKHNRPRQYRSKLPKPDRNGDVRPRIGGRRFTVGNVRTTSQGELERRMNSLKEFFDAQCDALGIDFWANWTKRSGGHLGHLGQLGQLDHRSNSTIPL